MIKKSIWCKKWFWCILVVLLGLPFGVVWSATRIPGSGQVRQLEAKMMRLKISRADMATSATVDEKRILELSQELSVLPVGSFGLVSAWPLLAFSDIGGTWLDCYVRKHGKTLEELRTAGIYVPSSELDVTDSSGHRVPLSSRAMPYVLLARSLACANASLAVRCAQTADWKGVIAHVEAAADSGRGLDDFGELGFGTQLFCSSKALHVLNLLARTDVSLTTALALKDTAHALRERMPRPSETVFLRQARAWALEADGQTHETWASGFSNLVQTRLSLNGVDRRFVEPLVAQFSPWMPWTGVRGNMASVKTALWEDPDMFPNRLGRIEPFSDMDPVTRVLYLNRVGSGFVELAREVDRLHTTWALVEAGYAAKAFRIENDRWPEISDLHPKYLAEPPDSEGNWPTPVDSGDRLFPKGPRTTGRLEIRSYEVREIQRYLNHLPGDVAANSGPNRRENGGDFEVVVKLPAAGETPLIGFALADALKKLYGDGIQGVEISLPGGSSVMPKDEATRRTLANIHPSYVDCFAGATAAPEMPPEVKRELILQVRGSIPRTRYAVLARQTVAQSEVDENPIFLE